MLELVKCFFKDFLVVIELSNDVKLDFSSLFIYNLMAIRFRLLSLRSLEALLLHASAPTSCWREKFCVLFVKHV